MSSRRDLLQQAGATGLCAALPLNVADRRLEAAEGWAIKASNGSRPRIKSMTRREETVVRYAGYGDNWHMSWASDDRQYVSLCDGPGFATHPRVSYNSRMLAISGGPRDAKFHDLPGYPMLGKPSQRPMDPRYYNFGTLALDGRLYQYMSTFNRSFRADEMEKYKPHETVRFIGAKLIYSPDNGRTWHNQNGSTPVFWEPWDRRSRDSMVFFEEDQEAFSLLTVLQMGKNYEHNGDGYIYVYSPNGNTEGTMNELVMFRVPAAKLLDRSSYEYFGGRGVNGAAKWTADIKARAVVHTFPRGWVNTLVHPYAWHPSVVYNAALGVYMMANWGMGTAPDGMWFNKPSYLGFWISDTPCGPWEQVYEETAWMPERSNAARAYEPQIAPKWIAADGKSFWLVWTDFQVTDKEAAKLAVQDFKRTTLANSYTEEDVVQSATKMRRYRPYYAFNVQRVDIDVA